MFPFLVRAISDNAADIIKAAVTATGAVLVAVLPDILEDRRTQRDRAREAAERLTKLPDREPRYYRQHPVTCSECGAVHKTIDPSANCMKCSACGAVQHITPEIGRGR